MIQLTYISCCEFREGSPNLVYGLALLLDECLHNNTRLGVTGVLAFQDGQFLQVLEGPDDVVDALFERIRGDHRHGRIQLVARVPCSRRTFPGWVMGYIGWEHALRPLFDAAEEGTGGLTQARITGALSQMLA